MSRVTKEFQYGDHRVILETGRLARQATGAVLVTMAKPSCCDRGRIENNPSRHRLLPVDRDYQEKTYAAGKIPGGFFKREGRPSEKETLTSRLIDRPIRPLFPKASRTKCRSSAPSCRQQEDTDPDIAAMIGTSAALAVSGIPFDGPIGAARVALHERVGYLLNPTYEQLKESRLDMVVAGTAEAVLMVESEAQELTEDQMLGAVLFAHEEFQVVIKPIKELAAEAGKPAWNWAPAAQKRPRCWALSGRSVKRSRRSLSHHRQTRADRYARLGELRDQAVAKLSGEEGAAIHADEVKAAFGKSNTASFAKAS